MAADIASWVKRSADPARRARALALAASRCSTSRSTRASSAPRRSRAGPMRNARISEGYRLATSAFTMRCGHAGGEEVEGRAAVRRAVAGACAGSAAPGAQIGAHQQRIDHAGGGARVGEPLVAAGRHAREREGGAAEHARHAGDLVDVGGRVAPDALGVACGTPRRSGRRGCTRDRARRCRGAARRL